MLIHQKDEINAIIEDAVRKMKDRIHKSPVATTKDGIVELMAKLISDGIDKLED